MVGSKLQYWKILTTNKTVIIFYTTINISFFALHLHKPITNYLKAMQIFIKNISDNKYLPRIGLSAFAVSTIVFCNMAKICFMN